MKVDKGEAEGFAIPLLGSYLSGPERAYVSEALTSLNNLSYGPHLGKLKGVLEELTGAHVSLVSSGTAGIHLALLALGVKAGDRVAVASHSFIASCSPVIQIGAEPVFVDSDPVSWTLDPVLFEGWLREQKCEQSIPRALVVVDLFGNFPDFERLDKLCSEFNIPIIEDAAHALGGNYKGRPAGALGDLGIFSLNGNKIVTGATGGVVIAREKRLIDRIDFLSGHCKTDTENSLGEYVHAEVGFNYRLNNLSAALSLAQLTDLEERKERKRKIAERYRTALEKMNGVENMPVTPGANHTFWLNCFRINPLEFGVEAATVVRSLRSQGIEAKLVWKPLHMQPAFSGCSSVGGSVSELLNRCGVCLPSSVGITGREQDRVLSAIEALHVR